MGITLDRSRWRGFRTAGYVLPILILVAVPLSAWSDDLVTLSGKTYHDVHPVRVEPDGVTWQHAGGVGKVDFSDSPASVRAAYHYDATQATAYRDAQAQSRRQSELEGQRLVRAHEDQQLALATAAVANTPASAAQELILRRGSSPAASAATRALAEQITAAQAKQAEASSGDASVFVSPRLWSILPRVGNYHPTHFLDVANTEEYKVDLHHAAGGFAPDSVHDDFYNPLYATRSYYEDTDRAAAFARGVPLKP